jgi:CubicO group peptidase (beta-lactamase class C family)
MRLFLSLCAAVLFAAAGEPASQLPSTTGAKIDELAAKALADSGTPSASIAIVQGNNVVYEKAYGKARLSPPRMPRARCVQSSAWLI